MISSEVERTLVKSPPELWAELSNQDSLARHLGQLGEIRITRVHPEESVEWEAQDTTGTITIKPSGWGTTVKLTAVRELPIVGTAGELEPQPAAEPPSMPEPASEADAHPEPGPTPEPEPTPGPEQATAETSPEATLTAEVTPAALAPERAALESPPEPGEAVAEASEPARRGFLARLFSRRKRPDDVALARATMLEAPAAPVAPITQDEPSPSAAEDPWDDTGLASASREEDTPSDPFATVRSVLAPETVAGAHLFAAESTPDATPAGPAPTQTAPDIAAELMAAEDVAAEEVATEEVTAVLTAVLDRLGAAHHRPFSRA